MVKTLDWSHLRRLGRNDNGGRWHPTDDVAKEYIELMGYRSPSRAWPQSYARPLMTAKFIKWARENHPEFLAKLGVNDGN